MFLQIIHTHQKTSSILIFGNDLFFLCHLNSGGIWGTNIVWSPHLKIPGTADAENWFLQGVWTIIFQFIHINLFMSEARSRFFSENISEIIAIISNIFLLFAQCLWWRLSMAIKHFGKSKNSTLQFFCDWLIVHRQRTRLLLGPKPSCGPIP